jgi:hypothetical protein
MPAIKTPKGVFATIGGQERADPRFAPAGTTRMSWMVSPLST